MKNYNRRPPAPTYEIHPHSIKYITSGHPWVTKDSYTKNFPTTPGLIGAGASTDKPTWILLNDPEHPQVKARVWGPYSNSKIKETTFWTDFEMRLNTSIDFRTKQKLEEDRDNYYLVFGEADNIPGLFIQKLGEIILIQSYSGYWKYFEKIVLNIVERNCQQTFPMEPLKYYFQSRNKNQSVQLDQLNYKKQLVKNIDEFDFEISEFGIKYNCFLGRSYDLGIYTDMSAIREKIGELISPEANVLNLYSYTGAFSLLALAKDAKSVASVDLSEKYLAVLNQNIDVNNFSKEKHSTYQMDVLQALELFEQENKKFDLIICDPPSASSDGKKVSSALKSYETLIPKMKSLLTKDGRLAIFLNTHTVNWNKFEKTLIPICEKNNLKKLRRFNFGKDCRALKGFPEGDYLKGLLLQR